MSSSNSSSSSCSIITIPVTLNVMNLPLGTTEEVLMEYFSRYDTDVKLVAIIEDPEKTELMRALVRFQDWSKAERVIIEPNHVILNHTVEVAKIVKATMSVSDQPKPGKLFVGGLPLDVTTNHLIAFFQQYGEIIDCFIPFTRETRRPRGFGFVVFRCEVSANAALGNMENRYIDMWGNRVEVKKAIPKDSGSGSHGLANHSSDNRSGSHGSDNQPENHSSDDRSRNPTEIHSSDNG